MPRDLHTQGSVEGTGMAVGEVDLCLFVGSACVLHRKSERHAVAGLRLLLSNLIPGQMKQDRRKMCSKAETGAQEAALAAKATV